MRKNEFMACWQVGIVKFHMNLCRSYLVSAKRWHLVPSPPTDTTFPMLAPTCSQALPMLPTPEADFYVISSWVLVPTWSRNKAPDKSKYYKKKMQNPISKSFSHCSIKNIAYDTIYLCGKCVKYSLWKQLEALQHQKSLGMHPLSKHTLHHQPPCPPHATHKSTKLGEQGHLPLLTTFFYKKKSNMSMR